jgi:putative oxidoreductase
MSTGLLILRIVVGGLFVGHGAQKLFGWFGGHGLEGSAAFMRSLEYRNGRVAALLAGLTETLSGALLVFGLLTPLAVAGIVGVMINVMPPHLRNGVWNANGGIELPLVYTAAATALGFTGAGAFSLDRLFGLHLNGVGFGLGALVLGLVAGLTTLMVYRERASRVDDEPSRIDRIAA